MISKTWINDAKVKFKPDHMEAMCKPTSTKRNKKTLHIGNLTIPTMGQADPSNLITLNAS